MKDVAAAAGVSPMTVSRAFRADAPVDRQTRERILRIAEEVGYVFDERASALRMQKSGFVAVTVPTLNNSNFALTVDAISTQLALARVQVLLGYDQYDINEEEARIEQLLRRRPEAVVVTGGHHTERARRLLKTCGVPVVETWDMPEDPIQHVVGFSNAKAMALVVDHLVARGARRIALIGGDFAGDARGVDRRVGFRVAMERHGLVADLLLPLGGPTTVSGGAMAMASLIDAQSNVDAVIGIFDHAAFGALTECQRRGIRVPDDLLIAGFGATEYAETMVPSLTTVDPHAAEIGRRAGQLIDDLIAGKNETGPIRIEIGPVLKIGQSTNG